MPLRGVMTGGGDGQTSTTNSVVLTLPAGCVAGDVALIGVCVNLTSLTVTTPTGWTLASGPNDAGTLMRGYSFTKTLTSGDISAGTVTVAFAAGGTGRLLAIGEVWSGVNAPGSPVVGVLSTVSTTWTLPAVTTTTDLTEVVTLLNFRKAATPRPTVTWPAQDTKDNGVGSNYASGANVSGSAAHLTIPGPAGSYGADAVTFSTSSAAVSYAYPLVPVSTGPTSVSGNDAGAVTDVAALAATSSTTDAVTLSDVVTYSAAGSVIDSAAVTESAVVLVLQSGTDSTVFTESSSVVTSQAVSPTDAAAVSEVAAVAVSAVRSDASVLTEGPAARAAASSDTVSFTESTSSAAAAAGSDVAISADVSQLNAGSSPSGIDGSVFDETATATVTAATTDAGTVTDGGAVVAMTFLAGADSPTVTEAVSVAAAAATVDTSAAGETETVGAVLSTRADSASLTEATPSISGSGGDPVTLAEAALLVATLEAVEEAALAESTQMLVDLLAIDTWALDDLATAAPLRPPRDVTVLSVVGIDRPVTATELARSTAVTALPGRAVTIEEIP